MHEAGAAVVAAQLLAFYKEPVRYRARLTHGREAFPGGLLVFRFAHGKFSHALMRDLTAAERERLRVAATFLIRQVCLWEGATHYQLLCVPANARRETIKEHYHGLIAVLHPDRREHGAGPWPPTAAQRVNQAYAVLCDEEQRRLYDAGLHAAQTPTLDDPAMEVPLTATAARPPIVGRLAAARIRLRRPALVFSAVVASLFFAQVWWFGDLPREYATLAGATPFDLSSRWIRDVSGGERPRFMGSAQARAVETAPEAAAEAPLPILAPLWRALSTRTAEVRPAPAIDTRPIRIEPAEKARDEPALAPTPPLVVAQAAAPKAAVAGVSTPVAGVSTLDMEVLVAQLVTYYEGGDLDRLLALYDVGSIGFWEAIRIRQDFQDFFRSTRARRLRLTRVSWETGTQSAHARGEAALYAEYADAGGKIERNVPLELDVIVRNGGPRIARLSLFPHAR